MGVPQTVGFVLEVRYDRWERGTELPRTVEFVFHEFDKMLQRYHTERKRRKLADRATSARYVLFLTDHGKQACAADPDCAARHSDVGTWHNMDR